MKTKALNLKKTTAISEELKKFADSISCFSGEYDRVFIELSKTLPAIERRIEENVFEARSLLNFVFAGERGDDSYGVKHEISQFHQQLDIALTMLRETDAMDKRIFSELSESIEISNAAVMKMKDIFNISENLKVFALNSIIHSQKAGDRGKGYQVISGEFIKLSEQITKGTETIQDIGQKADSLISILLQLIKEYQYHSRHHIEAVAVDSKRLKHNSNNSVENFSAILNDLLNRIDSVKAPTCEIMVELQKQDIIQQQLQHIMESMDDILVIIDRYSDQFGSGSADGEDEARWKELISLYTLIDFLVVSTEKQMTRINEELIKMMDVLEELFFRMQSAITDINQDRNHFSEIVLPEEASKKEATVVHLLFQAPEKMIVKIVENLRNNLEKKRNIINKFSLIEDKINSEQHKAQDFLPLIEAINNLLLLSRIEQARYNLVLSAQSSNHVSDFTPESFSELTSIIDEMEESHHLISRNLERSISGFDSQRIKYDEMEMQLNDSISILKKTEYLFVENFQTIMKITADLFGEIQQYIDLLATLRSLNKELNRKIGICMDVHLDVQDQLERLGGAAKIEDCLFKDVILQKVVQKCTVQQERETLNKEFAEIDIEVSAGSSITLF